MENVLVVVLGTCVFILCNVDLFGNIKEIFWLVFACLKQLSGPFLVILPHFFVHLFFDKIPSMEHFSFGFNTIYLFQNSSWVTTVQSGSASCLAAAGELAWPDFKMVGGRWCWWVHIVPREWQWWATIKSRPLGVRETSGVREKEEEGR